MLYDIRTVFNIKRCSKENAPNIYLSVVLIRLVDLILLPLIITLIGSIILGHLFVLI